MVKKCAYCDMRVTKCLCIKPKVEKRVPKLVPDSGQSQLPVEMNNWQRLRSWRKWMETEGVRLGLWVQPEKHLSSQDRAQKRLEEPK